jgi:NADH-quinone oxidoreductase subunit N
LSEWNVLLAAPEWILSATVLLLLWIDARAPGGARRPRYGSVAAAGVALATVAALLQAPEAKAYAFLGAYGADAFTSLLKLLFGLTALFVLALSGAWLRRVDRGHGEFHLLLLLATLGMFFVCSVEDFAGLFVSLELITVSFYCLTAFKRNDERSVEAGVKYVVLGSLASAFLLLGVAFLYGATGSLKLGALGSAAFTRDLEFGGGALSTLGLLLVLAGLGFKIAAVPFQIWTPDVYEGAASPVTAFLSMGSKAAGVALLLKVVRACLGESGAAGLAEAGPWIALLAFVSGATLLYGNLGAMGQGNIKRLLGYSSIGHAGYVLMGLLAFDSDGFAAVLYYLMAYLFTVIGVFAVVVVVNGALRSHRIDDYGGLGRRSPLLALLLTCGLLSLAGVPPLGGFFAKFLVFRAIVAKGTAVAYTLAFVGAAGVVISLYYYLLVVKRLYMDEGAADALPAPLPLSRPMRAVVYACLAGVFLLGIFHAPFLQVAERAAAALLAAR